jgi:hypothetical protein
MFLLTKKPPPLARISNSLLKHKHRLTPGSIPSKTSYRLKILDITESIYILSLGKPGEKGPL